MGVTRARRHLWLSWAPSRTGGGARRKPSRFLDGIRPETEPVRPARPSGKKKQKAKGLDCRECGRPLAPGAELKLGRHTDCPSSYDADLVAALHLWRERVAAAAKLPAFCVFTDSTLVAIAEADGIGAALKRHNGRIGVTAAALGITRKTLYLKMRRYGLSSSAALAD